MNSTEIEILVTATLITSFIGLIFWGIQTYLNNRREKEKEAEKQRNEQRQKFLGPNGIAPKDVNEAVMIAKKEGRDTRLPSTSNSILRLLIIFFIIAGMGSVSYYYSQVIVTPTVEPATQSPIMTTTTLQASPSSTSESAPTPTITSTSLIARSLADDCLFSGTWKVASTDSSVLNDVTTKNDGCYDTGSLGIFPDQNGILRILNRDNSQQLASGIFTPISYDSVIEFQVHVNFMYSVDVENPTYINFAIAHASDPMNTRNTARFKLQLEDTGNDPRIYFVLAEVGENNGSRLSTQHYEDGRTYTIRLELTGSVMAVFINNSRQNENLAIPSNPNVFYIGYNLPTLAGVDVEVTNVRIDGVFR